MRDWFDPVYVSPIIIVLLLVAAACVGFALHGLDADEAEPQIVAEFWWVPYARVPVYFNDLPRFVRVRAVDKGIARGLMKPLRPWSP